MSKSIFVYSNKSFQQCMKKIDHVTQYILNEENLSCDMEDKQKGEIGKKGR
jgi:hypothetical protein